MATTTIVSHTYKLKRGKEDAVLNANPLLLAGEPIVVFRNDGSTNIKIGDGVTYYRDLPWITSTMSQADYEQNDSTADDYIKNRPCYTEEIETTLTLLDGTFDFEEDLEVGLYISFQDNSSLIFEEGKTYTVVFDGTSYSCIGYIPVEGLPTVLGNASLTDPSMSGGNNEPFIILSNGQLFIATNLTDASHTVKITTQEITTNIKQLDEKYIPDSIKCVQSDWNQNDSSSKDYIKNKPAIATDDDVMDFLAGMEMITPVTNSDGEILISSSNEIYSL